MPSNMPFFQAASNKTASLAVAGAAVAALTATGRKAGRRLHALHEAALMSHIQQMGEVTELGRCFCFLSWTPSLTSLVQDVNSLKPKLMSSSLIPALASHLC